MADSDELALSTSRTRGRPLPAARADLRAQLPGLEPERQVTDWGRSERVEALVDRTVYDFLYHYWFRVEVEGIENIPGDGGALIVANHSGAAPSDAAMVTKALREEHSRRRSVHLATGAHRSSLPIVGMLARKLGAVSDHPANVHRLLFDERQLVLGFPEGEDGARKPIKERYRLRRFDGEGLLAGALRADVPIIPLAVLGAEEAAPVFAAAPAFAAAQALRRIPYLRLAPVLPLPAKFRLRFLEPVAPAELGAGTGRNAAALRSLAEDLRALIQENLLEMVGERRSVWLG